MERVNWSSLVRNIGKGRSRKALFFKPVCVIAAIDLADRGRIAPNNIDAIAVLRRFSDYVTPFEKDRGEEGYQPLWHLSNNRLWTFFRGEQALTSKEFRDGKPGSEKRLLERFDRLAIDESVRKLWSSQDERRALRDQMLLMLLDDDHPDSQQFVKPLFDPQHLLDRDRWPSQESLDSYFAPLRQPSLFDAPGWGLDPIEPARPERPAAAVGAPAAVENVPSPVDYIWSEHRIVVGPNQASLPLFPFAASKRDHTVRLEASAMLAQDLLSDLARQRWQVREDYRLQIARYADRLPKEVGSGNVLLADTAVRILRDMFAADQAILPAGFGASLRALLQQHYALRPFYPEIDSLYQAVRSGRIEEPLPIDAVNDVMEVVREQTPTVFDESVSAAIDEAAAPEPRRAIVDEAGTGDDEIVAPPPDPMGELDPGKAHDVQVASAFNRLWKVFTAADKVQSSTAAWIKAYDDLSGPMKPVLDWLRRFLEQ